MQTARRRPSIPTALVALVLTLATACSPEPTPSASPPRPSSTPDRTKVVGDLELEACDPAGLLPCEQQAVILVEPVAATGVALTYSTEWADGRLDRPAWNADALGLGGWALDVLQRYDPDRRILLSGDGSWRFADALDIGNGERAVPTYDGFRYFVFDAGWRHVRTVDSVTGIALLTITYDAEGRVMGASGAGAGWPVSLTVERGSDGSLRYLVGTGETRTQPVANGAGLIAVVGRPDGTQLGVNYFEGGLVSVWQATGLGVTSYAWDDRGRLAKATDPDSVWRELAFEAGDGTAQTTIKDPNGGTATLRTERADGKLHRTFTDTDGTVTELETASDGSTRLVEPDGTVTTIGAVAHPRWGLAAAVRTPVVERRPDGTEYRVETTTTMGTGSPEPAGGAWTAQATVNGQRDSAAYDPATKRLTVTDGAGRQSSWTFDDEGRVIAQRVPGRPPAIVAYDDAGFVASVTIGEGEAAATTINEYDSVAGTVVTTLPDGSITELGLDPFGRLVRATKPGENLAFGYDPAGGILQLRPGAHPATSFGYSEAGRETAYVPPAVGDDAWYELTSYTRAGQVSTISDQAGKRVEIEYDEAGRATSWTFDLGTSTATWDPTSGLLASNESPDGVTTSFTYDGSVATGIAWSGTLAGEVRVTLDGLLQPTSVSVNGAGGLPMTYDGSGLLTSIAGLQVERDAATGLPTRATLGGVATTFEYDAQLRLVESTSTSGGKPVLTARYVRDLLGRVTSVERTDASGKATTTELGYDGSGRLASYERGSTSTTYAYDAAGNRAVSAGEATTATVDDRDRLTRQGKDSYRYSPDGTLLEHEGAGGTTTYAFDTLGALRSVVLPGGRRIEYVIDAGGRRIGRTVDGDLADGYLYGVDDTIVAWTDGSGLVRAQFAYDNGRLALVRRDGRDLVVVTDQVGSPIAVLDGQTGAVVAEAAYDAWGNLVEGSMADVLPFGFAGGLADPDTGLVHFGARDYDPATGRWTSPDPLRYGGGDTNLYRYAGGDPVNSVDPTGTTPRAAGSGAGGSVTSAGGRRGGGGGGASRPGGGGATSPYHNGGPSKPSSAPVPGHGKPIGPVDTPYGYNNQNNLGGPNYNPKQPQPGADQPTNPTTHPMTWCVFGCYTPGEGADTRTPAKPDTCIGYCKEKPNGTQCFGICGGGSPGKDEFTCILYCVYGEPHLLTADGQPVDFQAAGEFVALRSSDGAFEIQARYEPSRVVSTVTMTTAVAMRVGPDRVGIYRNPDTGISKHELVINGETIDRASYSTKLPGGGIVERLGADISVTWPDGSRLTAHLYSKFLNVSMAPNDAVAANAVGLLGGKDGDPANDLVTRDGTVLDPESDGFRDELYGPFAASWRVSEAESLFDYFDDESTETFQDPTVPEHVTVDDLDAATRARAEALCRAMGVGAEPFLTACIFDVGMTGDPDFAGSAATVAASEERAAVVPLDLGPSIAFGQPVNGLLTTGTVQPYHFRANAGDVVYLDAAADCSPGVRWRLATPEGSPIATEEACRDIGRRVLATAGEWRIEVYSDTDATGPFAFRVLSAPKPTERPIAIGGTATGATTAPGEWHRYVFEASAGQIVYLDGTGDCASPMWWRLGRDGGAIDLARACEDLGRWELPEAGRWVVEVYADDLGTGPYAFRLLTVAPPRERSISIGQAVTDNIGAIGEWHRYRFAGRAGQRVVIETGDACVGEILWRLLPPGRAAVSIGTSCTDSSVQTLDADGDWVVEVFSDTTATGAYSFTVKPAP